MIKRLRKWFLPTEKVTLGDILRTSYSSGNQAITPRSILSHPAVWRGVDLISTSVAKIPYSVYETDEDGSRKTAKSHPAYPLLKLRPNEIYSRFQLIKCWVVNTLTYGDGFVFIDRDDIGRPIGLYLLDSSTVTIVNEDRSLYYFVRDHQGKIQTLDASQVLHLRGLGNDGVSGLPIYKVLADAFGLGLTLQRYQNVYFQNSGKPSVVIKLQDELSKEEIEEFRDAWGNVHQGVENSFKPAFLRPGADITTLQSDSAIESLSNLREHDLITIAGCLGIPPHKLGAKSVSVSYGSLEQENLSFIQDIDGWTTQLEQELSLKMLRQSEIATHYIEGNRESQVQADSKTKAELLAIYRSNGMLSDEEIRRKLNQPVDFEGTFWTSTSLTERSKAMHSPAVEAIQEEEVEDTEEKAASLAKQITKSTVERLLRRASKTGKFELWNEEFGMLEGFANLQLPHEELESVLPEQRQAVIDQLDADTITEVLWTK